MKSTKHTKRILINAMTTFNAKAAKFAKKIGFAVFATFAVNVVEHCPRDLRVLRDFVMRPNRGA